jgi:hypothetical protein
MAILNGTKNNDLIIIQSNTTSVQAGAGTDVAVLSGDYTDYSFYLLNRYIPVISHNFTGQVVKLFGVEKIQFNDQYGDIVSNSLFVDKVDSYNKKSTDIAQLSNNNYVLTYQKSGSTSTQSYDGIYAQIYDTSGELIGSEIPVYIHDVPSYMLDNGEGVQSNYPKIVALDNGEFIVAWFMNEKTSKSNFMEGVFAKHYDSNGVLIEDYLILVIPS